jgi:adenylosuccinate synthase
MRLFEDKGAHVLVDGQYGSTGKGVLAAWLALQAKEQGREFAGVISNAGPNSGHTFYHEGEKHVLKQLPTFAVASTLMGRYAPAYLSAGAVINPEILLAEAKKYPDQYIMIHPRAVLIRPEDIEAEHSGTVLAVAGTASGTGAAIARKVLRDPEAVFESWARRNGHRMPGNVALFPYIPDVRKMPYFVEVSQGFSLGINQQFYPKGTSRECTVQQAISDASIPARHVSKVYASFRTFPIRVGNFGGHSSGGWYGDQLETRWDDLGLQPELTTVTQRIRRIATFSAQQFRDAVRVNDPDWVFVNFLNYPRQDPDVLSVVRNIRNEGGLRDFGLIGSVGAESEDVEILDYGRDTAGG